MINNTFSDCNIWFELAKNNRKPGKNMVSTSIENCQNDVLLNESKK